MGWNVSNCQSTRRKHFRFCPSRIAARFQHAAFQIALRGAEETLAPGRRDVQRMAAILELLEHAGADGGLQPDAVRIEIMRREEAGKMLAAEFGGLDRLLQGHSEHHAVQEELQLP